MKLENQNILITSNEPWSDVWFSKHNYAWELAKKNNVFFINSPEKWKVSNLFFQDVTAAKITDKLTVITIQNTLPSTFAFLKEINNFLVSQKIKKFLLKQKLKEWILWSFTPLFLFRPKLLKSKLTLFHIVDQNWTTFHGTKQLVNASDGLIFVSEHLLSEYNFTQAKKIVVEHGISEEESVIDGIKDNEIQNELKKYGRFGLYVGVLDKRFDLSLFQKMVQACSHTFFLLVGPINLKDNHAYKYLFNGITKNVICLGKKPYKELKYYIRHSAFCISPMDLNHSGNDISHHKTLTYLIHGKPIFSPKFKAYEEFSELLYQDNDSECLVQKMKNYINNGENDKLVEARIGLAKKYFYANHLAKIEKFINEITSFNNGR